MDTTMWPDYEFDTRLGQGQTIYIIDSGYRSTHEVRGVIGISRKSHHGMQGQWQWRAYRLGA